MKYIGNRNGVLLSRIWISAPHFGLINRALIILENVPSYLDRATKPSIKRNKINYRKTNYSIHEKRVADTSND